MLIFLILALARHGVYGCCKYYYALYKNYGVMKRNLGGGLGYLIRKSADIAIDFDLLLIQRSTSFMLCIFNGTSHFGHPSS